MHRRVPADRMIQVELDGEPVPAVEGEPVAVSLIAAGVQLFSRSIKYHRPRGAFCLAGDCGQCLMRIDGVPNVFACQASAHAGMKLERQNAFPSATVDVFSAVDLFFPGGLDPHHLLAGVPIAQDVMARVTRQLAGLGTLPERAAEPSPAAELRATPIAIVGGGVSGVAASQWLSARGHAHVLCDKAHRVLGIYLDTKGRFLLVREDRPNESRLLKLYATRIVLACGGHASILPFEDNDLPGIYSLQALARLLSLGIDIGRHPVLIGRGPILQTGLTLFQRAGVGSVRPVSIDDVSELRAHGTLGQVSALSYRSNQGELERIACDAIGICLPSTPRFELAKQAGAEVDPEPSSGGFVVRIDAGGCTTAQGIFAAGRLVGADDEGTARASGERAAQAATEERA